jgi:hypothetical protein
VPPLQEHPPLWHVAALGGRSSAGLPSKKPTGFSMKPM